MIRHVLVLLLPLLLGGCVTLAPTHITDPRQGAIVMRLTPNELPGSQAQGAWGTIEFLDLDHASEPFAPSIQLRWKAQSYVQSVVYGGAMKPGRYVISKMTMPDQSYILPHLRFGQFEVKSGQITYLGHVIQLNDPEERKVLLGHPAGLPDTREAETIVRETFPGFVPLLANPVNGWKFSDSFDFVSLSDPAKFLRSLSTDANRQTAQRYEHIRQRAAGYLSPLERANGDVLFGSLLGTLKRWHPGGDLSTLDLGTTNAVAAIAELKDGTLLAGGDHAFLKASTDGGATWTDVANDLPFGVISDIKELADGRLHLTLLRREQVQTYAGRLGEAKWTALASVPKPFNFSANGNSRLPPRSYLQDSTVFTLVPGTQLLAYDTTAGTSQVRKLPGIAREFTVAGNGTLYCLCDSTALLAFNYVSKDGGKSWEPLRTPKMMGMPRFRDERHGMALERTLMSTPHLLATDDGGATWTPRASGAGGALLGYLRDGKTLLAEGTNGQVYFSQDEGTNWDPIGRRN